MLMKPLALPPSYITQPLPMHGSWACREARVPTIDQFEVVVAKMTSETLLECRDRAIIAFLILFGARDGSIPSFKLHHLNLVKRTLFHDARSVKTKGAKIFISIFFPVSDLFVTILTEYVSRLTEEERFGPDDPLFPAADGPCARSRLLRGWPVQTSLEKCVADLPRRSRRI